MDENTHLPGGNGKPPKKRKYSQKHIPEYHKLPPPGVILTDQDMMAILHVCINTLSNYRKYRNLPFFKVGTRNKYRSEEIVLDRRKNPQY